MADHEYLFQNRTDDVDQELAVEGTVPHELSGTFYGIGGAGNAVGDTALHPLDAHGRVVAATFGHGRASLRARMVQTPLWQAERTASAIVKRRFFTNKPGRWSNLFDVDLANPAGHCVVRWGKHLVATNDPGFFVLDPHTLETRGPAPVGPAKGSTFCPMPRRDPATGHWIVFEHKPGLRDVMTVREIDDEFTVVSARTYKLPRGAAFFHDVAVTEHYYLVMQWGSISLPTMLWGAARVADAVGFDASKTPMLHLLPRSGGAATSIPMPGGRMHFHFWNAFERDGQVVVDAIGYEGQVTFTTSLPPKARDGAAVTPTPPSSSWRYTVDPKTGRLEVAPLTALPAEAPAIHPERRGRPYRYGWAPTAGEAGDEIDRNDFIWFHALARHDFETRTTDVWHAGPRTFVSAAAFVPRAGGTAEDDGHVLAFLQDAAADRTSIAIFEANAIAKGPVAKLTAPGLLGGLTHVAFA